MRAVVFHVRLGGGRKCEKFAGVALEGVPGGRKGETAGFAVKEGRVELALKAFEPQAHGRGRHAEFFRGVRDVERAREREKGFEVGKVEMHDRAARLVVSLSSLTILTIFVRAQKADFHRPLRQGRRTDKMSSFSFFRTRKSRTPYGDIRL